MLQTLKKENTKDKARFYVLRSSYLVKRGKVSQRMSQAKKQRTDPSVGEACGESSEHGLGIWARGWGQRACLSRTLTTCHTSLVPRDC